MESDNKITLNLTPNVIDGEELETLFSTVFSQMAKYVSRTYGPYGANTAYQVNNKVLITKDGWSVEQSLIYPKSVMASVIRKMAVDVSTAINLRAGDGTTTGVIAANAINEALMAWKKENKIHAKTITKNLEYCIEKICDKLIENSTKITEENLAEYIYNVALVSLDWDTEFAGFIRDIYVNTGNPIIKVQNSGTEHSFVEYNEGYDMSARLLSEFKVNHVGEKKYTSNRPIILIFSYTVGTELFERLLTTSTFLNQRLGTELFILAPDFDKNFRDKYNQYCIYQAKHKAPLPSMVMVKYFAEYNIEREMLIDFSFLTGAAINAKGNDEIEEIMDEFTRITKQPSPTREQFETDTQFQNAVSEFKQSLINAGDELIEHMQRFLGVCDELTVDDKQLVAKGFGDIENSDAIKERMSTIQAEITKAEKDMSAKSMITDEIGLKKIRLGKLKLKMATINVGGFGDSQLKAKRDALDDAIKACEKAYAEGVVPGGEIAIIKAVGDLMSEEKDSLRKNFLVIIYESFVKTALTMFYNKYGDDKCPDYKDNELSKNVIYEAERRNTPWNLITNEFDETIVHPVRVDIEVIKGVLNLVLTTTTTNQFLFAAYDNAGEELEGMREVKG